MESPNCSHEIFDKKAAQAVSLDLALSTSMITVAQPPLQ